MTSLSGWCSGPTGAIDGFHDTCEQRMAAGLIASCSCPNHGGTLASQGVSASATGRIGGSKTAPGGATNTVAPGASPTNKESTSA